MKHLCSILFLLALTPVQLQADDSNGNFAIWGMGNKSCHSLATISQEIQMRSNGTKTI